MFHVHTYSFVPNFICSRFFASTSELQRVIRPPVSPRWKMEKHGGGRFNSSGEFIA